MGPGGRAPPGGPGPTCRAPQCQPSRFCPCNRSRLSPFPPRPGCALGPHSATSGRCPQRTQPAASRGHLPGPGCSAADHFLLQSPSKLLKRTPFWCVQAPMISASGLYRRQRPRREGSSSARCSFAALLCLIPRRCLRAQARRRTPAHPHPRGGGGPGLSGVLGVQCVRSRVSDHRA